MKKGKYAKGGPGIKALALVLTLVLLVGGTVGGTLAWLMDKSDPVVNTFTDSDIEIELTETKSDFKMIPGWTIDKDPYITVKKDSEDCWLFVQVDEENDLSQYIDYCVNVNADTISVEKILNEGAENAETISVMHGGWTQGENANGVPANVYFRKVTANSAPQYFAVLGGGEATYSGVKCSWQNDEVLTKPTVTKSMMDELNAEGADKPTLTFTAYAVQLYKSNNTEFTAAEAWAQAQTLKADSGSGT